MTQQNAARRRRYSAREHELRRRGDLQPEPEQLSQFRDVVGFSRYVDRGPDRRVDRPNWPWEPDRRATTAQEPPPAALRPSAPPGQGPAEDAGLQLTSGGPCDDDLTCRFSGRRGIRGQGLVEFALLLPVILLMLLGGIECGLLIASKIEQDRATVVVVDWAAKHPGDESWHAIAAHQLPGCDVQRLDHPDDPPDVLTIGATCTYQPRATRGLHIFDDLPVSSEASAITAAEPTPPAPSESVAP